MAKIVPFPTNFNCFKNRKPSLSIFMSQNFKSISDLIDNEPYIYPAACTASIVAGEERSKKWRLLHCNPPWNRTMTTLLAYGRLRAVPGQQQKHHLDDESMESRSIHSWTHLHSNSEVVWYKNKHSRWANIQCNATLHTDIKSPNLDWPRNTPQTHASCNLYFRAVMI